MYCTLPFAGHSAMFTEAIHTLVDVGNQAVLGYGLREASKAPDNRYQYGYGRAAFFYSLLSALTTFGYAPFAFPPLFGEWG